jgi:hypothetical protein
VHTTYVWIIDPVPVLLRIYLSISLVRIITICLAQICSIGGIVYAMSILLGIHFFIRFVGVVTVSLSKICCLGGVNRLIRFPLPLDRLVAFARLAVEATGTDVVELVSMSFWVNFYVCLESVVGVGFS